MLENKKHYKRTEKKPSEEYIPGLRYLKIHKKGRPMRETMPLFVGKFTLKKRITNEDVLRTIKQYS